MVAVDIPDKVRIVLPPQSREQSKVELQSGRQHTLSAALFRRDGLAFTRPHLNQPSGFSVKGSPADISIPERCEFEWKTSLPTLVTLIPAIRLGHRPVSSAPLKGVGLTSVLAIGNGDRGQTDVSVTVTCGQPVAEGAGGLFTWGTSSSLQKPVFSWQGEASINIHLKPDYHSFTHLIPAPINVSPQPENLNVALPNEWTSSRLPSVLRLSPHGIFRLSPKVLPSSNVFASLLKLTPDHKFLEIQRLNASGVFGRSENVRLQLSCAGSCIEIHTEAISNDYWIVNIWNRDAVGTQVKKTSNCFSF